MSNILANNINPRSGTSIDVGGTLQVGSATTIHTTGIDLGSGSIQSHNIDSVGIITAKAGIHVTGGNVGIGTDGPGSLVDIASGDLEFSNKANSSAIQTINFSDGTQGRGKIRYLHDGDNLTFHTFSDERLRITSDGKVGIATDMTSQNVLLSIFSDGTSSKKPATLYQTALSGTGSGNGFYVGTNHNDQVGYVWNYEADALSFATNNVQRARIDSDGYMTVAPSGMVIRSGFYDPGTGTGAITATNSTTFTTLNVNGTGQVGHNIGKASDDVLTYTKVSSNSHLNIGISFPFYLATGGNGFGIRGYLSTNDGSNYYTMSGLTNGPTHGWSAGGYGGNTSGVLNYTWNTRMNSSQASTILAKTGTIRFYFEVRVWNAADTLYFIDYGGSYPKKGSIVVQEIAE